MDEHWVKAHTAEGVPYYYHKETRETRWEKPDPKVGKQMEARRLRAEAEKERRRAARLAELKSREATQGSMAAEKEAVSAGVSKVIDTWAANAGWRASKKKAIGGRRPVTILATLLATLDRIPGLPAEKVALDPRSAADGAVKKGYLKTVRKIHPDKLAAGASAKVRASSEMAFAVLSAVYSAMS